MAQDGVSLSGVAGRYASALYDLASEKHAADEVAAALAAFQSLINESADLKRLVTIADTIEGQALVMRKGAREYRLVKIKN